MVKLSVVKAPGNRPIMLCADEKKSRTSQTITEARSSSLESSVRGHNEAVELLIEHARLQRSRLG